MNKSYNDTDTTQDRLTNLEIKTSFTEDLLDEINQTLYRQQQQIEQLTRALRLLHQQSAQASDSAGVAPGPRDELPPHY